MKLHFLRVLFLIFLLYFCFFAGCAPKKMQIQVPDQPVATSETIMPGDKEKAGTIASASPVYHKDPFYPSEPEGEQVAAEEKQPLEPGSQMAEFEEVAPPQEFVDEFEQFEEEFGVQKEPPVAYERTQMPDLSDLEARIGVYQNKLSRWIRLEENLVSLDMDEALLVRLQECKLFTEQILSDYKTLREIILAEHEVNRELLASWEFFKQDVEYLESGCEKVYAGCSENVNSWLDEFNVITAEQLEMAISNFAASKKYNDILAGFEQLTKSFPERKPGVKTRIEYTNALVQTGKINEAVDILKGVAADLKFTETDIHVVNRKLADMLFAIGNIADAKVYYQELSQFYLSLGKEERWTSDQLNLLENVDPNTSELQAFLTFLEKYIVFDGMNMPQDLPKQVAHLENTFPYSLFTQRAKQVLQMVEEQINTWALGQINLATDLAERKEFQKATQILVELLEQNIPQELHNDARKNLVLVRELAQFEKENQRFILEQSLAIQRDDAVNLLESQRYDEAIAAYSALLGTQYNDEALESIVKAADSAAKDKRRQAAGLFVKARKTNDPEQKRYLLYESRRLLQEILEKYPDVEIISKVQQNLAIIEENIQNLFPELLEESEIGMQDEYADPVTEEANYDSGY